jgi:hypothetical protein
VIDTIEDWQDVYLTTLGRRMVHAADEYYLMAGRDFPPAERYEGFTMHEDGIGMARTFEQEFHGLIDEPSGTRRGFFAAVDIPRNPTDYRTSCHDHPSPTQSVTLAPRRWAPIGVLTGVLGAKVLEPLVAALGNTAVSGLMVGADVARVLAGEPAGHRYLLPDVCLSDDGRFLDGATVGDLPRQVEVIATDGQALRAALDDRVGRGR